MAKKKPQTLTSEMIKLLQDDSGAALILYACLADTNENIQKMSEQELVDTFVFLSPDLIKERFQSMVDKLEPFRLKRG